MQIQRHTAPLIVRSASLNFAYTNYRPARVHGWQRVFNMAHSGNMRHEGTWHYTAEVASLAFMRSPHAVSDVVLLDVDDQGLEGFLKREHLYYIFMRSSCCLSPIVMHALAGMTS